MAWRLGFSSTLHTTALIGGFPYHATTSAALGANSWSATHAPTASPLQIDSFAAQNTPDGGNARAEFFRDRRTVPMGPAGWRCLPFHKLRTKTLTLCLNAQ